MFLAPWFAVAGLVAAAGPILIHLLNRRRFKVVEWAAMDFLREALFRSRRMLQIRDFLLLALRTACILLFGAALAQPFFAATGDMGANQPVHAILLIDNSLSMSYQRLGGTVLDEAKRQAQSMIENLPRGSRISVLPTCGLPSGATLDAHYTKQDALEALEAIQWVDRQTKPRETLDLAIAAAGRTASPARKQVVLFTDQQVDEWSAAQLADQLDQVPGGVKLIDLRSDPADVENSYVAEFNVRDAVVDLHTPATFVAVVCHQGPSERRNVPVSLIVEGQVVQTVSVDLLPGQRREIEFEPYPFDVAAEPGRPYFAAAEVVLPPDRLPGDDRRELIVPVVAALPVVFVDQFGRDEDPRRGRYGETYHLRRLLAPIGNQAARDKQLVRAEHRTIDELDQSLLEDARLVVVAGVPFPGAAAQLLRQYVEQGGSLVIAAGGLFDPAAWTQDAWLQGKGILPVPLDAVLVGRLPEESPNRVEYFQLDFNSLKDHEYFALEGVATEQLRDLYGAVYFFKAAAAQFNDEIKQQAVDASLEELRGREAAVSEIERELARLAGSDGAGNLSAAERRRQQELEQQRAKIIPNWLRWTEGMIDESSSLPVEQRAELSRPVVVARFTNGLPFMVERRIGRGKVLLIASGVFSGGDSAWNTLSISNAVLMYDRILRGAMRQTLPQRNLSTERALLLPVPAVQRNARFTLSGPNTQDVPLNTESLGAGQYGLRIRECMWRGIYRVTAHRPADAPGADGPLWEVVLAANGPSEESSLLRDSAANLREKAGRAAGLETEKAVALGLQRAQIGGTQLWKWVMIAVLVCLLAELFVLAWPALRGRNA